MNARDEKAAEEAKKMMALAGIKEDDKKFLTNESFQESNPEPTSNEDDFAVIKFDREEVEPGKEDDELYTLGK